MSESEDLSFHSVAMPSEPFKSRFLKTDKSKALLEEQTKSKPPIPQSAAPLPGSIRAMRSTFSPLAKLPENRIAGAPENIAVKPNGEQLSNNIKEFINRTDHVTAEWKNLGQNKSVRGAYSGPHRRAGSTDRERGRSPMASDYSVFCFTFSHFLRSMQFFCIKRALDYFQFDNSDY